LIDQAIQYMKEFPPHSLLSLAKEYKCQTSKITQKGLTSGSLVDYPPAWLLAPTFIPKTKRKLNLRGKKDKYVEKHINNTESDLTADVCDPKDILFIDAAKTASGYALYRESTTPPSSILRSTYYAAWILCRLVLQRVERTARRKRLTY